MDRERRRRRRSPGLGRRDGRLEAELLGHTGVVITVDWSADSRRLVSGGSDGTARVWEMGTPSAARS